MGGTIQVTLGTARDFVRQIPDAAGNLFDPDTNPSPFVLSDVLSARVWPGGNLAPILTPTPTWLDPAVGTYTVSFQANDTAALAPGAYRYQAFVTRGSRTGKIDDARFVIGATSGDGTASLAFTTRTDLLLYAPWLEDLQEPEDEAGFSAEQLRATNRLINVLVHAYRPGGMGLNAGQPGWMAWLNGFSRYQSSYWLRQQLVPLVPESPPPGSLPDRKSTPANHEDPTLSTALLLYAEVKEICARWAIAYVCDRQVSRDDKRDYPMLAARFGREAEGLYRAQKFEIDLSNPQTGYASIIIDGGSGSLRE